MNSDMAMTHGDLLVTRTHKSTSLEHLMPPSRPASASGRPRSRPSSKRSSRPASAMPSIRGSQPASLPPSIPPSWASLYSGDYKPSTEKSVAHLRSNPSVKSALQSAIDGDSGPAMIGVSSYPYSATQRNYIDDFEMLVASTITHPYIGSTCFNKGSSPHNLMRGSNFAPSYDIFQSTAARSWVPKSYKQAFNTKASGVRSEQVRFLG